MHRRSIKLLMLGFLAGLFLPALCLSQSQSISDKAAFAEREYQEGERLRTEASAAVEMETRDQTSARYRDSSAHLVKARDLFRELGNVGAEAACIAQLGLIEESLRNDAKAVEYYRGAAALFASVNNLKEVGSQKLQIGGIYYRNKKCGLAIANYNEALAASRSAQDPRVEAGALAGMGICYKLFGHQQKVIEYFSAAANVAEKSGDKERQAEDYQYLGSAYSTIGQFQRALTYYATAAELVRDIAGKSAAVTRALSLQGSANVMGKLGEGRKVLELELAAISILDDFPAEKATLADAFLRVAETYGVLGDTASALKYSQQAFDIFHELNRSYGQADALRLRAQIYEFNFKDYPTAQKLFEQALALAAEAKDPGMQGKITSELGGLAESQGNYQKEIEYKRKAFQFYKDAHDILGQAHMLYALGVAYNERGKTADSANTFSNALLYFALLDRGSNVAETFVGLALVRSGTGNLKLATVYAKQAIITQQKYRATISTLDTATQRSYLRQIEINYRFVADLLIRQGRLREAHQILTILKDEQSLDVADKPFDNAISPNIALTAREQQLLRIYDATIDETRKIRDRQDELTRLDFGGTITPEQKAEFEQLGERMGTAFQNLIDTVEGKVAEFAKPLDKDDEVADTAENKAMWNMLATVSEQTGEPTVAIYQLVWPGGGIYSLVVTRDDVRYVATPTKDLNAKAKTFWALLQSERYDPRIAGKELYDLVFKPLEKFIPANTKTILWSLDGNLRYVPMGALFDGEHYLVERFNHVTLTRSDTARLTAPVAAKWTATGFGSSKARTVQNLDKAIWFSALPGVGTELRSLFTMPKRKLLDGELLLDQSFTRDALLERLRQKRPVVHIASHFSFQPGDDTRSFLLLGDGTPFTLAEMKKQKDMFAGVELLTLSACNTAAQQADANGREVDAFFELAQRLGAQSVLATLWPVADNSTPWLMREFYDLKVNKKQNKAEALRNAQLALLNGSAKAARSATRSDASQVKIVVEGETEVKATTRAETFTIEKKDAKLFVPDPKRPFAHPFYWSPFVLIGNWR